MGDGLQDIGFPSTCLTPKYAHGHTHTYTHPTKFMNILMFERMQVFVGHLPLQFPFSPHSTELARL